VGLYPNYPKSRTEKLILTEAIIDAATLQSHLSIIDYGLLSLYGTNGLTQEHKEAIGQLKQLKEIIFFFDGDEAGRAAVKKYSTLFKETIGMGKQLEISFVETPNNEDVNSLLEGHEPNILEELIEKREKVHSPESLDVRKEDSIQENLGLSTQDSLLNTANPELLKYETDALHIHILGGIKMNGLDRLRVTLKIMSKEKPYLFPIRHSLDLYHHKHTQELAENISTQLEITHEKAKNQLNYLTGNLELKKTQSQLYPLKQLTPCLQTLLPLLPDQ